MILGWSPHSTLRDGSAGPLLDYLTGETVRKSVGGTARVTWRDPLPEPLVGSAAIVRQTIEGLRFKHSYSAATLSFAVTDVPIEEFNAGQDPHRDRVGRILRLFFDVAYAGIAPEHRPPLFANTHTHTGRLEVNVVLPRMVLRPGASGPAQMMAFNPHPPGKASLRLWDSFTDTVNGCFGYADPRGIDLMRLVGLPDWQLKASAEANRRGLGALRDQRTQLAAHALTLYECGAVSDRASLLYEMEAALLDRGIEIVAVTHSTVTFANRHGERWRMRGHLFSDAFSPEHPVHDLPEYDYREYRLSALRLAPERLRRALERRAAFHRHRYRGTHPLPDPHAMLHAPPMPMPPRHPGHQPKQFRTPIASRLATLVARIAERMNLWIAERSVLRRVAAIDLRPYSSLRRQLERLDDRHPADPTARPGGAHIHHPHAGGVDRAAADSPGHGASAGHRGAAGRADGRVDGDQRSHAARGGRAGTGGFASGERRLSAGGGRAQPHAASEGCCDAEGVVLRPPAGSRAEVMVRLKRAASAAGIRDLRFRAGPNEVLKVSIKGEFNAIDEHGVHGSGNGGDIAALSQLAEMAELSSNAEPPSSNFSPRFDI
ncbi:hypothetical protein ACW9UR_24780 [Halovulum sp. GXIMD14794]